jgi:hypothetical protein
MLDHHLDLLRAVRKNTLALLEPFPAEELNQIPPGFSNNLIWNAAHMLVTQQLLTYQRSGLPAAVSGDWIERFRKGSKPDQRVGPEEIRAIKKALQESPDWLQQDIEQGRFQTFEPYQTSYGVQLHSFNEAVVFNNIHENLHLGYMMALRKALAASS